jgi:probable phosphoglycerate mutase
MEIGADGTPWDRFNHLKDVGRLGNRYLLLRHGRSEANERRLITSDVTNARDRFGLTPQGRREVEETVARSRPPLGPDTVIYCSPFLRTRETADIAAGILGTAAPAIDDRLRERFCGTLEMTGSENYHRIWEQDAVDPAHTAFGSESACALLDRTTRLVRALEGRHAGRTILLVTHCDPAMILACGRAGGDLRAHFRGEAIRTGELRALP